MLPAHVIAAGMANTEGLPQVGELSLALVLSAVIGVERQIRQKSAGLRTHTLVGVGAALFMLISKYGFNDVVRPGLIIVDPSRVAAQIVTGVGFLGAGLIFVRQDGVRGLTTAASIWVTAAIGAAAGAGLPLLAGLTTVIYLVVALGFPELTRRLPRSGTAISVVRIRYPDGQGILRQILQLATARAFVVDQLSTEMVGPEAVNGSRRGKTANGSGRGKTTGLATVEVVLNLVGQGSINDLAAAMSELPGVHAVVADDANLEPD